MEFRAKDRILSVLLWAMLLFLLYRTAGLLFKLFLPFLYGFSLSWLLRPLINGISRFSCAKKSFWSVSVLLFLYLLLALGIWWTVSFILQELQQFFDSLPQLTEQYLQPMAKTVRDHLPASLSRMIGAEDALSRIGEILMQLSAKALSVFSGWIAKAPSFFTAFLFTILSSFFISLDYESITRQIVKLLPKKAAELLFDLRHFTGQTLLRMGKASLILLLLTFLQASAGLYLLKAEKPLSMALVISLMDLLPVLGPGIILLPWALFSLAQGQIFFGVGLLSLYGIISTVRTVVEPKVLGKEFGLHPLATIMAMYAGAKLMGFGGILLAPVLLMYLLHLYRRYRPKLSVQQLKDLLFS